MTKAELLNIELPEVYKSNPELNEYLNDSEDGLPTVIEWIQSGRTVAEFECLQKLANVEMYKEINPLDSAGIQGRIEAYNERRLTLGS